MLLREGESDMLDKEENESPIPHKVNCEHCGKEIILESDDWMHNDRTGAYACDSAECTKAALQGSERTSSVSSYCPRCETQAELIAAKDEEIAELKKVNEDLRDRKDCICSPLISKDHRIEALTDERDKLRDAVESQNDWLERLVVLLDKHHNELIVPIKSRIHICKSALDSAAKGECEECERLRKGINEVRLDILNGEGARETTKKLHALGEKGDPR
jgi:FtsZ-binding cell division protein ZapB